jgi:hypothetical protein
VSAKIRIGEDWEISTVLNWFFLPMGPKLTVDPALEVVD